MSFTADVAGYAAVAILSLSLFAKCFMSFGVRVRGDSVPKEFAEFAGKTQLNVAEYEGIFMACFTFLSFVNAYSVPCTIVSIMLPLCQATFFFGRVATGTPMPFSPLGALPRYIGMGIMVYVLVAEIGFDTFGPGQGAAVVFILSLLTKCFMTARVRIAENTGGNVDPDFAAFASKTQLNVAEYEGIFMAALLFLHVQRHGGTMVTVVSIGLPLCQAIFFFGRIATGSVMPFSPLSALPRYVLMLVLAYILFSAVGLNTYGPGQAAAVVFALSCFCKMYMTAVVRVKQNTDTAGYAALDQTVKETHEFASKTQLNVAEYEGIFMAILFFLYLEKFESPLVVAISYMMPIAQAIYFFGRILTGQARPASPLGALPRYIAMGMSIYLVYVASVSV